MLPKRPLKKGPPTWGKDSSVACFGFCIVGSALCQALCQLLEGRVGDVGVIPMLKPGLNTPTASNPQPRTHAT